MKQLLPIYWLFLPLLLTLSTGYQEFNTIKGKITLSKCPKTFVKGEGYNKDGTEIMHSDDPLAKPDRNVIISLHPLTFKPKLTLTKDAYISQTEQTFVPSVLPVVVGSKVHFLNEDEFFHNVQSLTPKLRFSIGRRAPGISYSIKIKKSGIVDLSCDIHAHMNAKILSFETPYFSRIKADGTYIVEGLPDGKYRLEIFHPECGKLSDEVEISGGKITVLDYNMLIKP